jgi:hypothetical protein
MGLAAAAPLSLGDVEDKVRAHFPEGVDDSGTGAKAEHLVSQGGECAVQMPDGCLGVVFLEGVRRQMGGVVGRFYVVGDPDSHRLLLLAIRSFPPGISALTSPVMRR